jgi:hypothetical protein
LTNLQDGAYNVTVTETNTGCTQTASLNVGLTTTTFAVTGAITHNTKCVTPFNGAIILAVAPAAGPYSFAWTGPGGFTSNSKNITALAAGSYQVVVTDLASGCPDTETFVVNDNVPVITVTLDNNIGNTSCTTPFDGALLITATGGSGLFSYSWTGPNAFTSTAEDIANIEHGNYSVTITDLNLGCTATAAFSVDDDTTPVTLASQLIANNTKCQAPFDGSITVTAGGTPGPYTFSWTGPGGFTGTGASIGNLASGNYTVTITDQLLGCADSYTLAVNDNTPPVTVTVDGTIPNSSCTTPFNGSVSITAGGTPGPFSFAWTGPNGFTASTEDIAQLEDGNYTVTVSDISLGCVVSQAVNVGDNKPVVTVTQQSVIANTSCLPPFDGAATVSASGTAGPYTFSWTGPNSFAGAGASIGNLEAGNYTVTATDQILGCAGTLIVNVPDNTPTIAITTSVTNNTSCVTPFNGVINITAVNGSPGPFTFSWTGPNGFTSASQNIASLSGGNYEVTVTDTGVGCFDTYTIAVIDTAPVITAIPAAITPNTNCNSGMYRYVLV